jgi:hypothetical protein
MSPHEPASDALDAVAAGTNDEIVAGAQSRQIHQQFSTGSSLPTAKHFIQ